MNGTRFLVTASLLCVGLMLIGCKKDEQADAPAPPPAVAPKVKPAAGPSITATPNPVPAGEGLGTTTIAWTTGSAAWGEVYLAVGSQPEKLFTAGPKGSLDATWIAKGPVYEFRLYEGKERAKLLSSVKVTRQ